MNNEFLKELLELHPELAEAYNSQQYKLSLKILEEMMELSFDSNEMAEYLNLDYDEYIRMESGDTTISIERYEQVIKKIEELKEKKLSPFEILISNKGYLRFPESSSFTGNYKLRNEHTNYTVLVAKHDIAADGHVIIEVKSQGYKPEFKKYLTNKEIKPKNRMRNVFGNLLRTEHYAEQIFHKHPSSVVIGHTHRQNPSVITGSTYKQPLSVIAENFTERYTY